MELYDLKREFEELTGLRVDDYWRRYTGFDVIAFDIEIEPKTGEPTSEAVERLFGKRAVEVVRKLNSYSPLIGFVQTEEA